MVARARAPCSPDERVLARHVGRGEFRGLEFLHVHCRTIMNRVPGRSRMPFTWTINAYRGCSHACIYCFARPTHAYLDLGTGDDFDRVIVVKVNAVEQLRAELAAAALARRADRDGHQHRPVPAGRGEVPPHAGHRAAAGRAGQPVLDPDEVARSCCVTSTCWPRRPGRTRVRVDFSIATLDEDVWRRTEPGAPHPRRRVEAVAKLNDAGVAERRAARRGAARHLGQRGPVARGRRTPAWRRGRSRSAWSRSISAPA